MRKYIKWFFSVAINPTITTKRWTVTKSNWFTGYMENFWFKRNAVEYAKQQMDIFVDLEDVVKGSYVRIRDDSKNNPYPPRWTP